MLRPAPPAQPAYCRHNGKTRKARTQNSNGAWRVGLECLTCHKVFGPALPKGADFDDLPVVGPEYRNPPCAVQGCTEQFTEYQHWLPRGLAEKIGEAADAWPGAYLCRRHHMLWHGLVTPGLVSEGDKVYREYQLNTTTEERRVKALAGFLSGFEP